MENKFIAQAYQGKTNAWRYALGLLIAFLGIMLFSLPYRFFIKNKITNGEADATRIEDFNYLMGLLDSNTTLIYIMLPFVGGLLALWLVVTKLHQVKWSAFTTSRLNIDFKKIGFSFLLWGSISLVIVLLNWLIYPESMVLNFKASKFVLLFLISVILIPVQTSFEEYVFRGYLMQGLGIVTKTNWFPLILTSVVFGLMHLSNPEVVKLGYGVMSFYIGTGLLLGIMTLMDEGLELSLGFHLANNLITALMVTTDWTAFQTHAVFKDISAPSYGVEVLAMAVLYPLLLVILAKKYKWKNWKEKLI